jgi:hypothetical protein
MMDLTLSGGIDAMHMLTYLNTALPRLDNLTMILLDRPAGWALGAMFFNRLAKQAQYDHGDLALAANCYGMKSHMLNGALLGGVPYWATKHVHGNYGQVLLVAEDIPAVGQLAFHVRADDPVLAQVLNTAPAPDGRTWDGVPKQENITSWIIAYLRTKGVLYFGPQ